MGSSDKTRNEKQRCFFERLFTSHMYYTPNFQQFIVQQVRRMDYVSRQCCMVCSKKYSKMWGPSIHHRDLITMELSIYIYTSEVCLQSLYSVLTLGFGIGVRLNESPLLGTVPNYEGLSIYLYISKSSNQYEGRNIKGHINYESKFRKS